MVRTQIQLPEHLFREAKRIAADYEMSFAEVVRRSLERTLAAYPPKGAAAPQFARRRIYDTRLALTLRHHGVSDFATANVKDFEGFGFSRVWNPLGSA
jgi:hypothetical protein